MALNLSDITIYNSITNKLDDEKLDSLNAFSFVEYLNYSKSLTNEINNFENYEEYLKDWNKIVNKGNTDFKLEVKNQYIEFLKDITVNYTSSEEKRYLSNIDFDNEENLKIALPFYARKIKEIILYYKEKRDTYQKELRISKNKGSVKNLKEFIKSKIIDLFTGDDVPPDIQSGVSISDVPAKVNIEIEESYDTFNDYYDIDPNEPPDFYNAENERYVYFTSNTNYLSANEFLDLDKAIIDTINNKNIKLSELKVSPTIQVNTPDESLLDRTDYIDYNPTGRDNLKLLIHAELSKKLLGTDFYYLSTDTQGNYLSGVLFESEDKIFNVLNTSNPTSLTIPTFKDLNERDVGLFYRPTNFSVIKMKGDYDKFIKNDLSPDNFYIFPDPDQYGNINGLSKNKNFNPYTFNLGEGVYKNNSSSLGLKLPLQTNQDQGFYSYDTFEQKETNYKNLSSFDNKISDFFNKFILLENFTDIYNNRFYVCLEDTYFIKNNILGELTRNRPIFTGSRTLTTFTVSNEAKKNIIQKNDEFKNVYVQNISTNNFEPLSTQFNDYFNKYKFNSQLYNELNENILKFYIHNNILIIDTKNYSLIDAYEYNGKFININSQPLIIKRFKNLPDIEVSNVSNELILKDKIYKVNIEQTPTSLSSRNSTYYYEFLDYSLATNKVNYITNKNKNPLDYFDTNFNLGLSATVKKIKNASLSYNSKLNLFNLGVQYLDNNENSYFHNLTYNIFNNNLNIVSNDVYHPTNFYFTNNFYTEQFSDGNFEEAPLSSSPIIDNENGTITL